MNDNFHQIHGISSVLLKVQRSESGLAGVEEGLTTEEIARNKPEETMRVQNSSERKVSCANIIKAGMTDRYELECLACGSSWYISREKAATLNFYEQSFIKNTRTTSSDTTKLVSAEKKLSAASLH